MVELAFRVLSPHCEVMVAASAGEGLALAREAPPVLALVASPWPGMPFEEVAHELRLELPGTLVAELTLRERPSPAADRVVRKAQLYDDITELVAELHPHEDA